MTGRTRFLVLSYVQISRVSVTPLKRVVPTDTTVEVIQKNLKYDFTFLEKGNIFNL